MACSSPRSCKPPTQPKRRTLIFVHLTAPASHQAALAPSAKCAPIRAQPSMPEQLGSQLKSEVLLQVS